MAKAARGQQPLFIISVVMLLICVVGVVFWFAVPCLYYAFTGEVLLSLSRWFLGLVGIVASGFGFWGSAKLLEG